MIPSSIERNSSDKMLLIDEMITANEKTPNKMRNVLKRLRTGCSNINSDSPVVKPVAVNIEMTWKRAISFFNPVNVNSSTLISITIPMIAK